MKQETKEVNGTILRWKNYREAVANGAPREKRKRSENKNKKKSSYSIDMEFAVIRIELSGKTKEISDQSAYCILCLAAKKILNKGKINE